MTAEQIRERVHAGGLLPRHGPLVVMLSGGRDSVCLLDLASALGRDVEVRALHVNYGLRSEADGDERHCRELCRRLRVELDVVRAQHTPGAGNLQAWARELRYREARRVARDLDPAAPARACEEKSRGAQDLPGFDPAARARAREEARHGASDFDLAARARARGEASHGEREEPATRTLIATGHTASDQVETILYRLAASPGRRALLGMAPREGRIVRPLLELTREQTAAYCRARGLTWRDDASNEDERYARTRVRRGLVPALRAVHPAAEANVLRTAQLLRAEAEMIEGLLEAELKGATSIAVERLERLPAALARLVVIRLAEDAAGVFVPQAGGHVSEILALARRGGKAELHVGGLVVAVIEGGRLSMVRLAPQD